MRAQIPPEILIAKDNPIMIGRVFDCLHRHTAEKRCQGTCLPPGHCQYSIFLGLVGRQLDLPCDVKASESTETVLVLEREIILNVRWLAVLSSGSLVSSFTPV